MNNLQERFSDSVQKAREFIRDMPPRHCSRPDSKVGPFLTSLSITLVLFTLFLVLYDQVFISLLLISQSPPFFQITLYNPSYKTIGHQ